MTGLERDTAEYFTVDPVGMEWALGKVGGKEIQARDMLVLMAIAANANKMTGAYFGSAAAALAGKVDWKDSAVADCVWRLKRAGLVKRFMEGKTRRTYYCCNPRVFAMGSDAARQRLWQKWRSEAD